MIKVLLITNIPAPYTVDFLNELGKKVELTVLYEGETSAERNSSWYTVRTLNFQGVFLSESKISVKKYTEGNYDMIIVGNYASGVGRAAILHMNRKKIPFYLHVDGGIIKNDNFIKRKIKSYLMSSSVGIFSSGEQTNKYLKHYCKSPNILTYPFTSVRENVFCNSPLTHSQKRALREKKYSEEFVALYVGQIVHRKGLDVLLAAAKTLRSGIGVYCLGGAPTSELLTYIEDEKLTNVHFLDFVSPNEVLEEMRLADVLVLPTRNDIWGLVVNEALSQGTPVISSDMSIAGLELVRNNFNGFVFESENVEALSQAINDITSDVNTLDKMSAQCPSSVALYTIENMAETYYNDIVEFLNQKRG